VTLKTFNDFSRHWVSAPCLKPPAGGQCLVDVWWLASFVVENVVAESTWPSNELSFKVPYKGATKAGNEKGATFSGWLVMDQNV